MKPSCILTVLLATVTLSPRTAHAQDPEIAVSDVGQLRAAIAAAGPGDEIVLADGEYVIDRTFDCTAPGRADAPVVVRAANPLGAVVRSSAIVAFHAQAPHWAFQGLDIQGTCADHSQCEHAFHITGHADGTVVRSCRMRDWNAQIKGNGDFVGEGGVIVFPDDVLIEGNEMYSEAPRDTGNPVTPVDIVGGRRWIVRANYIHDHAKLGADQVSFAAFFKGNSRDGLMERNLVVCEQLHSGQIRLGLSFGGGGTQPDRFCEDGTCSPEHQGGVMRNNIIVRCPTDVGIYLNEATNAQVDHNTLFDTAGIDVRFQASTVALRNNLLDGRIRTRDGGTMDTAGNVEQVGVQALQAWFRDPGAADFTLLDGAAFVDQGVGAAGVANDYCGVARDDGAPDAGAVEYRAGAACDTTRPPLEAAAPGEVPDELPGEGEGEVQGGADEGAGEGEGEGVGQGEADEGGDEGAGDGGDDGDGQEGEGEVVDPGANGEAGQGPGALDDGPRGGGSRRDDGGLCASAPGAGGGRRLLFPRR